MDDRSDNDKPPHPEWPAPDPRKQTKRDKKGRIVKGSSGNYSGRPPKIVRPATDRERHRAILAEGERLVKIGGEPLTTTEAVLRKISHDALMGNHRAQEHYFNLQTEALKAVAASYNPEQNRHLEFLEDYVNSVGPGPGNVMLHMLNEARAKAKKI